MVGRRDHIGEYVDIMEALLVAEVVGELAVGPSDTCAIEKKRQVSLGFFFKCFPGASVKWTVRNKPHSQFSRKMDTRNWNSILHTGLEDFERFI